MDAGRAPRRRYGRRVVIRRSVRDWGVDAGVVAVAALLGGFFLFVTVIEEPAPSSLPPIGLDIGVAAAACLGLLLFRRRWPVTLALLFIPAALVSSAAMGPAAVALFTVAAHRGARPVALVAGLHMIVNLVILRFAPLTPRQYAEAVVFIVLLDGVVVATGLLLRSQRLLVGSLRDRARQAEEGQRMRVEEARHLERERLAREMHDVLAHRISLLAVHAGALEFRRGATAAEAHAAGVIRQSAYDALEDLREVLGMLRGTPGGSDSERPSPTLGDLPALVEESRRAGMRVLLDDRLGGGSGTVPAGLGRHIFRVVQEGLTNARKHAPGSKVTVTVATGARDAGADGGAGVNGGDGGAGVGSGGADEGVGGLTVEVVNPLPLAAPAAQIPGAGTGLIGLRERLDLVGGRLEHEWTPGGDFRLWAWLPWRP